MDPTSTSPRPDPGLIEELKGKHAELKKKQAGAPEGPKKRELTRQENVANLAEIALPSSPHEHPSTPLPPSRQLNGKEEKETQKTVEAVRQVLPQTDFEKQLEPVLKDRLNQIEHLLSEVGSGLRNAPEGFDKSKYDKLMGQAAALANTLNSLITPIPRSPLPTVEIFKDRIQYGLYGSQKESTQKLIVQVRTSILEISQKLVEGKAILDPSPKRTTKMKDDEKKSLNLLYHTLNLRFENTDPKSSYLLKNQLKELNESLVKLEKLTENKQDLTAIKEEVRVLINQAASLEPKVKAFNESYQHMS